MATATAKRVIELRAQDTCEDINILDLPVKYKGSVKGCKRYAARRGYCWVRSPGMLFGGYFVHPPTGNCLLPT